MRPRVFNPVPCKVCSTHFIPNSSGSRLCSAECYLATKIHHIPSDPDECWLLMKQTGKYVLSAFRARYVGMHVLSYETFKGPVPKGMEICHSCDNTKCVNPRHLRADTHVANCQDQVIRNRSLKGERNAQAKLTPDQVREIITSDETGVSLAQRFGVWDSTIRDIRKGKTWQNITGLRS